MTRALEALLTLRRGLPWVYDDGGRVAAGLRASTRQRDCVARAIAIATGLTYAHVADLINAAAEHERPGSKRKRGRRSNAQTGVFGDTTRRVLTGLGWRYVATMTIGSGCRVHLAVGELPAGRLVVQASRHLTAVVDGVVHDTHDPSRGGTRCVYGYWVRD